MGRGAVVLFEFEELRVGVILFEIEDVLNVGPAEGVNALGIVPHHADIFMHRPQLLDDEVLGKVGVLVLVDKDVLEAVLVLAEQVGEITQQDIHLEKQIVKVHGASSETSYLILGEDVREHGPTCLLVLRPNLGILRIGPGVQQVVLGRTDPRLNPCGLVCFVVQPHAFDDVLQKASAVLGVVDGEIAGIIDAFALDP